MNGRWQIHWVWVMASLVAASPAPRAAERIPPASPQDDFRWVRGVNYVPSYARNDVQIWMDYDPTVIERELGYAARLKLNSVRVFLQYVVYEHNPPEFLKRFEHFLASCEKHGIRAMPVVFDSCFGESPDLQTYRRRDWVANPGQERLGPEHWPKLEKYVEDVVGRHRDDKRILIWDVMNEPTCTSHAATEAGRKKIWTFLDHFLDVVNRADPNHPTTVGVEHTDLIPKVIQKIDVVATHNYRKDLREDIRRVRQMAAAAGKPAIINEVVRRDSQPFGFAMPILAEEKIGWYVWELMLGSTQFSRGETPVQGFIYPDGTCRDAADVAWILHPAGTGRSPREVAAGAGLPQRNRSR